MDTICGLLARAEESVDQVEMYCEGKAEIDDMDRSDQALQAAVEAVQARYAVVAASVTLEPVADWSRISARPAADEDKAEAATLTAMSLRLLQERSEENMDLVLAVLSCAEDASYMNRLNKEGKDPNNDMVEAQMSLRVAVDEVISRYRETLRR